MEAQSENQDSSKEGESGQEIQYYIVWFFFFFDFEEKDAEPEKKHDSWLGLFPNILFAIILILIQ